MGLEHTTRTARRRRWGSGVVAGVAVTGSLMFVAPPAAIAAPAPPSLPAFPLDALLPYLDLSSFDLTTLSAFEIPAITIDAAQRAAILAAVFDATGVLIQEVAGLVVGDTTTIVPDVTSPLPSADVPATVGVGGARLPLDRGAYRLTSNYGVRDNPTGAGRRNHQGIDLAADSGTPIYAVTGGTVVQAGDNGDGYGNLVRIKSGNTEVYYGHQSSVGVNVGDTVAAGQRIGSVGSTGNSTGPHLHFEVRRGGASVDPTGYLTALGLSVAGSSARD
ncbi:hypothetical protein GCM10007304_14530 [Rhodococcoides trifolii]|uniref:M23ase beta-sheet core domain-containing protein n=1 Tax=Rhodococcoides trifolii TaxID=908250 RepID=A0A917D018_9NOCA|nr:M23 family metallopeptidase [Rhodococcus trifolii]GGG01613.1 hypothetical protein GCM10007304_14530 [Rhodococcus trifolii]